MSDQREDIADTRPNKILPQKAKKSTALPVWLVGSGILLGSICLAFALVIGFLSLKGYITWPAVIPVVEAAPPPSTPLATSTPVNNVAVSTSTPPAATATAPVNSVVVTVQAATTATPTQPFVLTTVTAAPLTIIPSKPWAGNTYRAADCAKLVPDLLFVISQTGKPFQESEPSNQLDDFNFPPQVFQQISAARPTCTQHVIFNEVNNACTPAFCLIETGVITFSDSTMAKTMFSLIDQSYRGMAHNKSMLNWPLANTNAASCFSESSPTGGKGSAIRCTMQDGNSVTTTVMVSGDPFGQSFANAARQMILDNLQRNDDLANQALPK